MGPKLCFSGTGGSARKTSRLCVRRRRVLSSGWGLDVDRSGDRACGFRVSMAEPHLRVGQRVLPGGVRQQGIYLGELSHGWGTRGSEAGLHTPRRVDDTGIRAAFQYRDLQEWVLVWVRWPKRTGRLARLRGRGKRKSDVARDPGMDGHARDAWRVAKTAHGNVPGIVNGCRWILPVSRRDGTPALDGPDTQGI